MLIRVNLGDADLALCVLKGSTKLFIDGGEGLAVAAPGSEELDECWLARVEDGLVKVAGEQVKNCRFGGGGAEQRQSRRQEGCGAKIHGRGLLSGMESGRDEGGLCMGGLVKGKGHEACS